MAKWCVMPDCKCYHQWIIPGERKTCDAPDGFGCPVVKKEPMTLHEYQVKSQRTIDLSKTTRENAINFSFGLAGETGEVIDLLKKHLFHNHTLDTDKLKKELGDVLWYVAGLCSTYNISLEDVAQKNVKKLLERYPRGFSTKDSVERAE